MLSTAEYMAAGLCHSLVHLYIGHQYSPLEGGVYSPSPKGWITLQAGDGVVKAGLYFAAQVCDATQMIAAPK